MFVRCSWRKNGVARAPPSIANVHSLRELRPWLISDRGGSARHTVVSGDPAPTYAELAFVSTFLRGRTPRPPVTAYGRRCAHKLQGSICPVCLRLWRFLVLLCCVATFPRGRTPKPPISRFNMSRVLASFFRLRGPSLASLGIPKPKKGCVKAAHLFLSYEIKPYLCAMYIISWIKVILYCLFELVFNRRRFLKDTFHYAKWKYGLSD